MKTVYALALLAIAVVPASADVALYSNGPISGTISAWGIFGSQLISDSFVLSSASTIIGVDFGAWTRPRDAVTSVQWLIGTTPGDGSSGGGTATPTGTFFSDDDGGFTVDTDTFSTGSIGLGAGTYYLTLEHAATAQSGPAYWDVNNGPSLGFLSNDNWVNYGSLVNAGDILGSGSNAFDIQGTTGIVTPEPGSYAALILGFGGVMLMVRRRSARNNADNSGVRLFRPTSCP
jgi:hypothetical protein